MGFIHEELSKFATTHYEEIPREEDGSVELNDTNIVYNLEGMYQFTDNKIRKDIPLSIDIWYLKRSIYDIQNMAYDIDKVLYDVVFRKDGMVFRIVRDANFIVNIPDDNINVRRKRINYVVKYYKY